MVKIRYAALPAVNLSAYGVIQLAIEATSNKFDGNIKSNRFDAVGSHYEVTIKCKSSRGKGAKRGASGRHTTSCCWHAWGTFFEELLRLNPNIVIIAQGNRITSEGGNWVDRQTFLEGHDAYESEMCDCEVNGWDCSDHHAQWIAEQNAASQVIQDAEETIDNMIAATAQAETVYHNCNHTCRHSHTNNNGVSCTRSCVGIENPGWEPVRNCTTCRFDVNGHCEYDVRVGGNRPDSCPNVVWVVKTCENCKHNYDDNGSRHGCYPIVGLCSSRNKWARYDPNPFIVNGTPATRYDIPLGVEQMEMVQLRPRQFKIEEVE